MGETCRNGKDHPQVSVRLENEQTIDSDVSFPDNIHNESTQTIDRATSQWFANLDRIKDDALKALQDVSFFPPLCMSLHTLFGMVYL
jgi:hypothetical protein